MVRAPLGSENTMEWSWVVFFEIYITNSYGTSSMSSNPATHFCASTSLHSVSKSIPFFRNWRTSIIVLQFHAELWPASQFRVKFVLPLRLVSFSAIIVLRIIYKSVFIQRLNYIPFTYIFWTHHLNLPLSNTSDSSFPVAHFAVALSISHRRAIWESSIILEWN